MTTETQIRFEDALKEFDKRLTSATLTVKDGMDLFKLADNLLIRYEEIEKSRSRWKDKYFNLKNGV